MKKVIMVLGFMVFSVSSLFAQDIADHTIGLRFGSYGAFGAGVTYQMKLSDNTRVEANFSYRGHRYYTGVNVNAIYQIVNDFEPVENMNWYYGAGAGLGTWKYKSNYLYDIDESGTYFSLIGQAGMEYKFDFPLLLSLDLGPVLNMGDFDSGLYIGGGLSARYTF